MNPDKIGKFIKKLRKDNNLTQKDLADKYGVTYQAVSKWENGINLPDVTLIRQMSKDFNISVESILDGEIKKDNKKSNKHKYIIVVLAILLIVSIVIILTNKNNKSFNFKTVSSSCNEFKVSGSLAYNKNKSSIYISNINYCGGDDKTEYKEIECTLFEKSSNKNIKISSCKKDSGSIKLEDYLSNIELNINDYSQACNKYNDDSLYLEINATSKDNKITTYKIPLKLNENCSKNKLN